MNKVSALSPLSTIWCATTRSVRACPRTSPEDSISRTGPIERTSTTCASAPTTAMACGCSPAANRIRGISTARTSPTAHPCSTGATWSCRHRCRATRRAARSGSAAARRTASTWPRSARAHPTPSTRSRPPRGARRGRRPTRPTGRTICTAGIRPAESMVSSRRACPSRAVSSTRPRRCSPTSGPAFTSSRTRSGTASTGTSRTSSAIRSRTATPRTTRTASTPATVRVQRRLGRVLGQGHQLLPRSGERAVQHRDRGHGGARPR
jgi:hypothetical protein